MRDVGSAVAPDRIRAVDVVLLEACGNRVGDRVQGLLPLIPAVPAHQRDRGGRDLLEGALDLEPDFPRAELSHASVLHPFR